MNRPNERIVRAPRGGAPLVVRYDLRTLVIHGTEDPMLRYSHALALAKEIRGAESLPALDETDHVALRVAK
jgi:hypothetical protein